MASVDVVVGGRAPLSITRAEGYVRPDGANGTGHDGPAEMPLSTFNAMKEGQLYFQARRAYRGFPLVSEWAGERASVVIKYQ